MPSGESEQTGEAGPETPVEEKPKRKRVSRKKAADSPEDTSGGEAAGEAAQASEEEDTSSGASDDLSAQGGDTPEHDDDEDLDFGSIATLEDLSWKTALGIGCFQVLSLIPGTSRSGSTIIGGLLLGCTRSVASKFTFFLAIPVMFGASALKLVKYFIKGGTFGANEIAILGVGCVVAFVVSLIAIKWLMGFVRRHDFKCFGVYRIILGIVVLAYFFVLEPMLGL